MEGLGGAALQAAQGAPSVPTADARSRPQAPTSPTGGKRKRGVGGKQSAAQRARADAEAAAAATPVVDATGLKLNHIRLYCDMNNPAAAQFQLRLKEGEGKRGELTENARSNLLIELGIAKGEREEEIRVCRHYGIHRNTGREMQKRWRQRATVSTAPRSGRPRLGEGKSKKATVTGAPTATIAPAPPDTDAP